MRRLLLAVVFLLSWCLAAIAGEVLSNDTGEKAVGLRVVFSTPVLVTAYGDILTSVEPDSLSYEFVFSGGTVEPWGTHWLSWAPSTVQILSCEWLPETHLEFPRGSDSSEGETICGSAIGGRWGTTSFAIHDLPDEYFEFLCRMNVSWAQISVSLTITDSMDATVEPCDPGGSIETFSDVELRNLIRTLKHYGFHVYVTLAFENLGDGPVGKRVERWQLGDPFVFREASNVSEAFWPWAPSHSAHGTYVKTFFETYTRQAVHYATLAEEEDVEMFSLGTETDRLFRTRSNGSRWATNYRDELSSMVEQVREVFSGCLTYDMLYSTHLRDKSEWGDSEALWGDLDLDVVGVSAYFRLLDQQDTSHVPSVATLRESWERIFHETLTPLSARYPEKPIVFLEHGYTDAPGSASHPAQQEFTPRSWIDRDRNGLDDGEEEQANIYQALFEIMDENPGVLRGLFVWGDMIASDATWESGFGRMRDFSVRNRLAETVIAEWYERFCGNCTAEIGETAAIAYLPVEGQLSPADFADLPVILSWSQDSQPQCGVYDLNTHVWVETESPDERFGATGWRLHRIRGGIVDETLMLVLELASGDVPSGDVRVDHGLAFGDGNESIQIRPGGKVVLLYGASGESGQIWRPSPQHFLVVDNTIYLSIPLEEFPVVSTMLAPVGLTRVSYNAAYRGESTHAFAYFPGVGYLERL